MPTIRTVIGHTDAVAMLNRSLAAGRLSHAYLFTGPEGVGKATLALELAKALNCHAPDAPCNDCSVCRRIMRGRHPDVELVRPGGACDESDHDHSNDLGRDIRICQMRRLERVLSLSAFEGGHRALIIDPAEAMNAQAADAFLKTLEEPPEGTLIILVSAKEAMLSETIRSRCRRVSLGLLPVALTEAALRERFGVPSDEAARLTAIFGGALGAAVRAAGDPDFGARRAAMLTRAQEVATAGMVQRFKVAEELAAAWGKREKPTVRESDEPAEPRAAADGKPRVRADVLATLAVWTEWWRDRLLAGGGVNDATHPLTAPSEEARAPDIDPSLAAEGIRAVRDARRDLEQNVNPRLALEALMVRLPRIGAAHLSGVRR